MPGSMLEVCDWLLAKTKARGVLYLGRHGERCSSGDVGTADDVDVAVLISDTDDVEHEHFVHRQTSHGHGMACSLTSGYLVVFFDKPPRMELAIWLYAVVKEINRRLDAPESRHPGAGNPGSGAPAEVSALGRASKVGS